MPHFAKVMVAGSNPVVRSSQQVKRHVRRPFPSRGSTLEIGSFHIRAIGKLSLMALLVWGGQSATARAGCLPVTMYADGAA